MGWDKDVPALSSRPPRERCGEGISRSVLSFCKKQWMWGEKEMRPVSSCFREGEEEGLRSLEPRPVHPILGPAWDLGSDYRTTCPLWHPLSSFTLE